MRRRNVRSIYRRAAISFSLIIAILVIGTVGFHIIEGYPYIDSFYFISMLATAQGPATVPSTVGGKLFASLMAFVSVGTVIAALGFLFGPFFGTVWREGVLKVEEEEEKMKSKTERASPGGDENPPEN
ncbi:MAG TPA: hypothetical protein VMS77_07090 [Conexivisphaerales archaeon]|nr:hypothetical protein [Conexivisphaerales archaeon]